MTDTQTPEDQAAELDNVERDAIKWWNWKLLFTTINMVYSILNILRWNNFTLASFFTFFQSGMSTSSESVNADFHKL